MSNHTIVLYSMLHHITPLYRNKITLQLTMPFRTTPLVYTTLHTIHHTTSYHSTHCTTLCTAHHSIYHSVPHYTHHYIISFYSKHNTAPHFTPHHAILHNTHHTIPYHSALHYTTLHTTRHTSPYHSAAHTTLPHTSHHIIPFCTRTISRQWFVMARYHKSTYFYPLENCIQGGKTKVNPKSYVSVIFSSRVSLLNKRSCLKTWLGTFGYHCWFGHAIWRSFKNR